MWLTEKIVRALPVPASGNKIYYDEALPGFGVRITAAGFRSFILNYHAQDNRERRLTIGSPPAWNLVRARAATSAGSLQGLSSPPCPCWRAPRKRKQRSNQRRRRPPGRHLPRKSQHSVHHG
jgi:Arm DNA-binding domain